MKHYILLMGGILFGILFQSSNLFAQKPASVKFGKIEPALISMQQYDQDTSAAAVILMNRTSTSYSIQPDGVKLVYRVHKRVKVLKHSASELANIDIPYYRTNRYETISSIKGATYNASEKGKVEVSKLDRKSILTEEINENYSVKRFSLPNIKPGSVFEYSYVRNTADIVSIETFFFQDIYPVKYAEYAVEQPEYFMLQANFQGEPINFSQKNESSTSELGGNVKIMMASNVPAMKEEPFTNSFFNYMPRVSFRLNQINIPGQLYQEFGSSWNKIASEMLESEEYQRLMEGNGVKRMAAALNLMREDEDSDLEAITRFIRSSYEWNKRRGIWPSHSLNQLEKEKKANAATLNLLAIGLFRQVGVKAFPVLISTRSNGSTQRIYPYLDQFNHCIIALKEGEEIKFLDMSSYALAYDMLPYQDLNGQGLYMTKNGGIWTNIKAEYGATERTMAMLSIKDGMMQGTITMTDEGYSAANERGRFVQVEEDLDAYMEDRVGEKMPEGEISKPEVKNMREVNHDLTCKFEFETSDFLNDVGDFLYVQPMLFLAMEKNPFQSEKRTYPVDFGHALSSEYRATLMIPEGYEVESLPEPVKMSIPGNGGTFSYLVQKGGSSIQILTKYHLKKPVFAPHEYAHIRELFDQMVKKQGEQIVLRSVE
ncbi:MAG: DUF3857 domain-containing protein [Bacteroidota bacterium]